MRTDDFTLLRSYPASSKLNSLVDDLVAYFLYFGGVMFVPSNQRSSLWAGSNNEEEGIPRVWVVLRKLLLALGHDIRILIKDDESGLAASRLSLLLHSQARGEGSSV